MNRIDEESVAEDLVPDTGAGVRQENIRRTVGTDTVASSPKKVAMEVCRHLVQNEDLINKIHESELPPDEYYDALGPVLEKTFDGCDPKLAEHVAALLVVFDKASAFAMSFGIAKFQLAQTQVKLV